MAIKTLSVLVAGAHPDDPEYCGGGIAYLYAQQGHRVTFLSLTNGDAGHHTLHGPALAERRRAEASAAGKVLGVEYLILDNHDGLLTPSVEVRHQVVRVIRQVRPNLIICHRPYDYHPDHRAVGQVVPDAVFAAHLINIEPDLPAIPFDRTPVVVYAWDEFQKPYPFRPDVVVDIDAAIDRKVEAIACHACQFFDPSSPERAAEIPSDPAGRQAWLLGEWGPVLARPASLYRERLAGFYGSHRARRVQYAESFELCEYGAPLPLAEVSQLFPFFD